jgi:FkbM family methyltransferase
VLGRRVGAVYRLRDAPGVAVAVRHGTPDPESLDQIFVQGAVREPAHLRPLLDGLGRPPVVLDLGANAGYAAAWFAARWPGARIVCVEPDPYNLAVVGRAAGEMGGRWRVVEAAAAAEAGTLGFTIGGHSMSRVGGDVPVAAVDFFALAEEVGPDLVKMDIEGGEWPLLADERLARLGARVIALEFHAHRCPQPDARAMATGCLERAGYEVADVPHVEGASPDEGSLWAWRPSAAAS